MKWLTNSVHILATLNLGDEQPHDEKTKFA